MVFCVAYSHGTMHLGRIVIFIISMNIALIMGNDDSNNLDPDPETNNECYFNKGGACVHKRKFCPIPSEFPEPGNTRDCPPDFYCCVPVKDIFIDDKPKSKLTCGKNSLKEKRNRIFGGWRADSKEYPWLVLLRLGKSPACGGSIIGSRWIVTAAHCFREGLDVPEYWSVTVGEYDLLRLEKGNQFMEVEEIIVHPEYDENKKRNDIALIKLTEDIKYTDEAQPICLPEKENNFVGSVCIVAGWGHNNEYGRASQFMQVLNVPIVPDKYCKKVYQADYHSHNLCAGYDEYGRDACKGDSGGPLMCSFTHGAHKHWRIAGIVSWGTHCATPRYRGVYTKVSSFLPWIHQTMQDN